MHQEASKADVDLYVDSNRQPYTDIQHHPATPEHGETIVVVVDGDALGDLPADPTDIRIETPTTTIAPTIESSYLTFGFCPDKMETRLYLEVSDVGFGAGGSNATPTVIADGNVTLSERRVREAIKETDEERAHRRHQHPPTA